jgi:hypothetical protein
MARISTYQRDTDVTKNDKVIGTDSTGSVTKNFKLQDIAGFLRNSNSVGIATQFNFKFVTSNRTTQTISFNELGGNNTTFDNVTDFVLSKFDAENNNVSEYLKTYASKQIIIVRLDDYSNFGIFDVAAVVDHTTLSDFLAVTVTNRTNQGSFVADKHYGLAILSEGDKHYVHTQSTPSATWTVQHNLGKLPAVTTVNNNNIEVKGQIQYTDTNNLTITFSAGFSGKAYLN